jgi:two-component sensor histidine kinase
MEKLLQWLPEKPQPLLIRYGASTVIVALCFGLLKWVEARSGVSSFFLMYPAIFLAALLFDSGSGFLATGLSTALLAWSVESKGEDWQAYWLPLSLFLLIGLSLATLTELLRKGWEKAIEAERAKDLLYRELLHRTKNDFAMAASVLSLQARSQSNPEVRQALDTAVGRLLSLSKAHERLNPITAGQTGIVPMRDYLEALCRALKESIEHATPVALSVESDEVDLPVARAIPVGLIVNELVTNAYKHAFKGKQEGTLRVELHRAESLALTVEDDGVGCPENAASGVGSQLVQLLVRQLNGTMEHARAAQGCRVRVSFPEAD